MLLGKCWRSAGWSKGSCRKKHQVLISKLNTGFAEWVEGYICLLPDRFTENSHRRVTLTGKKGRYTKRREKRSKKEESFFITKKKTPKQTSQALLMINWTYWPLNYMDNQFLSLKDMSQEHCLCLTMSVVKHKTVLWVLPKGYPLLFCFISKMLSNNCTW